MLSFVMRMHVPEIEHFIQVIKECCRVSIVMLPFDQFSRRLIVGLLRTVVFCINEFPWPSGASQESNPLTIIEDFVLKYDVHFQVIFGEYSQPYKVTDNTMQERTVSTIAIGPSGNIQGGVLLFSLDTGHVVN